MRLETGERWRTTGYAYTRIREYLRMLGWIFGFMKMDKSWIYKRKQFSTMDG